MTCLRNVPWMLICSIAMLSSVCLQCLTQNDWLMFDKWLIIRLIICFTIYTLNEWLMNELIQPLLHCINDTKLFDKLITKWRVTNLWTWGIEPSMPYKCLIKDCLNPDVFRLFEWDLQSPPPEVLLDKCLMNVWWMFDEWLMIIWWLFDKYLMNVWWLIDECLMNDW